MTERQGTSRKGEIDLRVGDILWSILSWWRRILILSLAAALLIGGYTGLRQGLKLRDKSYIADAKEKNAQLKAVYNQDKARLNALKDHLRTQIQYQADFGESPVFQINPYAAHTMTIVYFAAADGESEDPEGPAASLSLAVLNAYQARIARIDILDIVFPDSPEIKDDSFDLGSALMMPLVDIEAHTMELTIVAPGPEYLAAVSAAIDRAVDEARPEIAQIVAPHKFSKLSESTAVKPNDNLIRIHTDYEKRMDTLMDKYTDVTTELTKLKSPSTTVVKMSQVLRSAVKKAALGGTLALFGALACAFLLVALRGRILSADDVLDNLPVSYLGPVNSGTGGKLDRLIARRRGLIPGRDRAAEVDYIAANLQPASAGIGAAAIIGGADKALMDELALALSGQMGDGKLLSAGNILTDADAVRACAGCDGVIIAETLDRSRRADVLSTYARAVSDGKKVLGLILSGTGK